MAHQPGPLGLPQEVGDPAQSRGSLGPFWVLSPRSPVPLTPSGRELLAWEHRAVADGRAAASSLFVPGPSGRAGTRLWVPEASPSEE